MLMHPAKMDHHMEHGGTSVIMGGGGGSDSLTLSRDIKRACELLEKLQKSKYCEFIKVGCGLS